ncbi:hypothetical protein RJ640_023199 [Escallonia rubra]|uniref:J domain-containing protein n=1 Tax=Escallonia rubra TaxID=112253 RepID=A0AA88S7K3_9ASTE|nr:hypothetical protein RJ640_023199 [Escallonia rubra]
MECNRDEATRAKTIAERKLLEKDFAGAKKFVMKAQALYPGLEGLPQMVTTLDVYISAENKVSGEVDWYGVLGVNPSADDETVKKQYRKLALTLHPDKNKSVGADGAFKLLSEAWSLLSDKSKRLAYNQRRSSVVFQQKVPTHSGRPSAPPSANGFHNYRNRATAKPRTHNTAPPPSYRRTDTFWTICQRCKMHYEYLKVYLNHTLLCPNCHEPFLASEMSPPANFPRSSTSSSRPRHQNSSYRAPNSSPFDPGRNTTTGQNSGLAGPDLSKHTNAQRGQFSTTASASGAEPSIAAKAANVVQQANERLKREREESQASAGWERPSKNRRELDNDGFYHGVKTPYQMATGNGGAGPRNISTNGIHGLSGMNSKPNSTRELSNLELRNMLIVKARMEISKKLNEWSLEMVKEGNKVKEKNTVRGDSHTVKVNGQSSASNREDQSKVSLASTAADDRVPFSMNVPDPDFHDFDLDRSESSFADNQVWAAYDNDDGMPRYYAFIHKVISRKPFKMKISWLNSKSNSEFGPMSWVGSGFTKTCGEFRVGKHEMNKSLNSFSHNVKWTKGTRGVVHIIPKKGDVWAIFRNWSDDWNESTPDEVIHKYDMVEVLDDYNEEQGVSVTPLVKVAGFKTVFHPHLDPDKVKRIPRAEMFRFSHQVPNYLLTGQEAQNAPKGCQELDPAATPVELLQVIIAANEVPVMENCGKDEEETLQCGPGDRTDEIADEPIKAEKNDMVENGEESKERGEDLEVQR